MYIDFVIQLKNAALARKKLVTTNFANLDKAISKVLVKEGFLDSVTDEKLGTQKMLTAKLRYHRRRPVITGVELVSKPSLRVYVESKDIAKKQGGSSIAVISTNQGVMTGKEAVKKGVGGEMLFKIW